MSDGDLAPATEPIEPRWGLPDAGLGWLLGQLLGATIGVGLIGLAGYGAEALRRGEVPFSVLALQYPPLWLGFVGVPLWAALTKGAGPVRDFRIRLRARVDLPLGAAVGLTCQFIVVPVVSLPLLWLLGRDPDDLSAPAEDLVGSAGSGVGLVLAVLLFVIGAPIAEELLFRGLLLRALVKRFNPTIAVLGAGLLFGVTHFQLLQFPALAAVGMIWAVLAWRLDRLGPAVVAHMAFNGVTLAALW